MVFLPVDGQLLYAVEFGDGDEVFVAHGGWAGSWEVWLEPFQLMSHRWRCIGYDHRGSGISTFPASAVTPRALVDDLFTVMDHFEVSKCVLAAESMGALTCLQAVLEQPERFSSLVLVGGVPAMPGPVDTARATQIRQAFPEYAAAFAERCLPEPDSEHLRAWGRHIVLRSDPEAAARLFEAHEEEGVVPDLASVSVPTLIIHGSEDANVPLEAARYVASSIPEAHLEVLDGVGHVPGLSVPDLLVGAIEGWWSGISQGGAGGPTS